jgi:hypothetical protein
MKKEDLVLGATYVINGGLPFGHSFSIGEKVTFHRDDGSLSPVFKSVETGTTQYVLVDWVEPQKQVKVGDKVRIINEGNNSSNGKFYRVGHEGVVVSAYDSTIRVDLTAYGLPLNMPSVDYGDFEVINVDPVAELKTAYDNAKTAYETAVREQKEAEQKAKEALKFTEDDIKESFVVELDTSRGGLRLVVLSNAGDVTFLNSKGTQSNSCSRTRLVDELNCLYKKTTKTLKDFANA